jgi:fructose-bisphosphate aldolase / 2-amino-3,7-dideoxy-D-threo-hept-6-ulosonate synthase
MKDSIASGVAVRVGRLVSPSSGRTLIVTLDATLFSGPFGALARPTTFADQIAAEGPEAILAFPGLLASISPERRVGRIVNGTASTLLDDPTRKVLTATPGTASRLGADAVGLHLILGHPDSPDMLRNVAAAIGEFDAVGIPTLVASYVPDVDPTGDWPKVAHAARVAADLGASIVKTAYTGSAETYAHVVEAARPAGVVAAGGPRQSALQALESARGAIDAGALGVAYGRSIFEAEEPLAVLRALKAVIHELSDPRAQAELLGRSGARDQEPSTKEPG